MGGKIFASIMTVGLTLLGAQSAAAAERSGTTTYIIAISGMPLAEANFKTAINGSRFNISGSFATVGLAHLVKRTSGNLHASGQVGKAGFNPSRYVTSYKSGNENKRFEIGFSRGNVVEVTQTPEPDSYPEEWVAVTEADLRRVADPLTGLLLPASNNVCRGTVPVFDGETRMDLALSAKKGRVFEVGDQKVDVQVCAVNFDVKSGYRKGRSDLEKVRGTKGIEIWFAKSPLADVYAPVHLKVPTKFGDLTVSAKRF